MKLTKSLISIILLWIIFSLVGLPTFTYAGEKEELQWKLRALIAESNLAQQTAISNSQEVTVARNAIHEFLRELDAKGYTVQRDGTVTEKPKPQEPKQSPAPPPPQSKK